jgi:outer membrane protein assembly factor BamB
MKSYALAIVLVLGLSQTATAACPGSCPIPGGGPKDPTKDCLSEWASTAMHLNYPPFDPANPTRLPRMVRCFDGEAGCDLDGQVNNQCVFDIDVCLRNSDPALPSCTPTDVDASTVTIPASGNPDLSALQSAVSGLLPATTNTCTTGQSLTVPLKGPNARGVYRKATKRVRLDTRSGTIKDIDVLKLFCMPHEWPMHGYNHANHRATATESLITTANASTLVTKWVFDPNLVGVGGGAVTSTPTVANGLVYVTHWSGWVHALNAKNGRVKWSYNTASGGQLGVQSSVTITADGRALVGDSLGVVHCLNAKTGALLWLANVGHPVTDSAHVWDSPVVANGRVFVGRASHSDVPCTQGHLYAFDLDTGAELWRYATVPAKVCNTDTAITCTTDADCGGSPGSCVPGKGGGVTASVAVDATGETVYMTTVGCYTSPSMGNSESFFSLSAATGTPNWIYRTQPIEQFADGPPYHDYGFLNGPLLIEGGIGGTQQLAVAGSKDGTLYALDQATGVPAWTRSLIPAPDFAGFGLFNGAIGFTNHKLLSTLFEVSNPASAWPAGNDHFFGFNDLDGSTAWSTQIGSSWGSVGVANGIVFAGTQASTNFYINDANTGASLKVVAMPGNVAGGATVVDGLVYVPYWGTNNGLMALGLP